MQQWFSMDFLSGEANKVFDIGCVCLTLPLFSLLSPYFDFYFSIFLAHDNVYVVIDWVEKRFRNILIV